MSRPPKKSGKKSGANYSALFGSGKSDSEKIQSFGVILEHLDSKMDYVIERLEGSVQMVDAKVDKIGQRLDTVDVKLDEHDRLLAVR